MSVRRIKILLLASSYPRNMADTASIFLRHFAEKLSAQGIDVHVLAPSDGKTDTTIEGAVTVHRELARAFQALVEPVRQDQVETPRVLADANERPQNDVVVVRRPFTLHAVGEDVALQVGVKTLDGKLQQFTVGVETGLPSVNVPVIDVLGAGRFSVPPPETVRLFAVSVSRFDETGLIVAVTPGATVIVASTVPDPRISVPPPTICGRPTSVTRSATGKATRSSLIRWGSMRNSGSSAPIRPPGSCISSNASRGRT